MMESNIFKIYFYLFSVVLFAQDKVIVIDPGHGGHDSGAVGYNNVYEKDINLIIGLKLKHYLKKTSNYKVVLTRSDDTFLPLKPTDLRSKIAVELKADLFISIHLNSSPSRRGSGVEVYIQKNPKTKEEYIDQSIKLAYLITQKLSNDLGYRNRGVKFKNLSVLRNTIEYMPSILLELGHVTNKDELKFMLNKGSDLIAKNIVNAINEVF